MRSYPCVGGPLNGQEVTREDLRPRLIAQSNTSRWSRGDVMREGGRFGNYANDYVEYNRASRNGPQPKRAMPTMLWLHVHLLDF